MKDAVREFGRDPLDEKVWRRLAAGMHYVSTDFAADQGEDALIDLLDEARRGARDRRATASSTSPSRRARSRRSSSGSAAAATTGRAGRG